MLIMEKYPINQENNSPTFQLHLETRYLLPICPKFQLSPKTQAFLKKKPKKGQEVTEAHQLILYNEFNYEFKNGAKLRLYPSQKCRSHANYRKVEPSPIILAR